MSENTDIISSFDRDQGLCRVHSRFVQGLGFPPFPMINCCTPVGSKEESMKSCEVLPDFQRYMYHIPHCLVSESKQMEDPHIIHYRYVRSLTTWRPDVHILSKVSIDNFPISLFRPQPDRKRCFCFHCLQSWPFIPILKTLRFCMYTKSHDSHNFVHVPKFTENTHIILGPVGD